MLPAAGFHQVSRLDKDGKRHLQVLRPPRHLSSIHRKFKSFLRSLENLQWMHKGGCLMRFWATTPARSKRKRLSILEQPFGVGEVCNGVCRYRYHSITCIQYANGFRDIGGFSPKIDSYSTEEFPLKNYAKDCGLQGYLALPVFEQKNDRQHQQRGSAGVLEILTFTETISLDTTFLEKLKGVGLAIRCPPPCRKPEGCRGRSDVRLVGLYPLRNLYNLPLIQKWLNGHAYFVEDGKGWVGRAYSRNQICLTEDIIGFGISDYPLAPPAHLSRFIAYRAIPFRLIHSYHPPLVPENFLPQHSVSDSRMDLLKPPLSTVQHRTGCQRLGNGKDHKVATVQEDNVQHYSTEKGPLGEAAKRLEDDQVQSHELGIGKEDLEVATVEENDVQHSRVKNRQLGEASRATKRLKGDQVQSKEASGSHVKKQLLRNEDDQEPGPNIRNRKITQDIIQNSFGRTLTDAAKELQVHTSTLKRWCRRYGIERWPSPKRNKPNPVLRPLNELGDCGDKEQECDSRPSPDHNSREKQVSDVKGPGNFSFDHHHSLIIKARYNECLVKFPFPTISGFEALLRSLAMRFKLETERIRIEYEDEDGDKVMISCDEDLSYHMHTLSSSGRTRMDLSILPAV